MSLYGWIIIATIAGPFALSFDKKVHFYSFWKALIPAVFSIGCLFLIWDEYFTQHAIWGFTSNYLSGKYLGHLPIEEVCFFLVVPYACIFIYEVLRAYFPLVKTKQIGHFFAFAITLSGLTFGIFNMDNWYTASACLSASILTIGFYFVNRVPWYGSFIFTYLVALIPFLIVNGILTGAVTDQPIVWYNEKHIIGTRIITIPLEDLFYNYALLLPIVGIYEFLKRKFQSSEVQN